MRYLLFTLFLLISITSQAQQTEAIRLSEPVIETDNFEIFGAEMDIKATEVAISLSDAILESDQETEMMINATINKVCMKKGCFFIAVDGDNSARVTFKDYGFFIPTNSAGKQVVFKGILSEKVLSEEQAMHFAEDAGESTDKIEGEQKEFSIVATSVLIPKSN